VVDRQVNPLNVSRRGRGVRFLGDSQDLASPPYLGR
jgi:hypothetical protein